MPVERSGAKLKVVVTYPAARLMDDLVCALTLRGIEVFVSGPDDYVGAPPASMVDVVCSTSARGALGGDSESELAYVILGGDAAGAELQALESGAVAFIDIDKPIEVSVALIEGVARRAQRQRDQEDRIVELESLCATDEVTGLHNQRYLFERLEEEYSRAKRYDYPLAVVALDIDGFKQVNDTTDHLFGTYVLEELGKILATEFRRADILCRFGGDEFFAVLPHVTTDGALVAAERARTVIAGHLFHRGTHRRRISASFGVAGIPSHRVRSGEDLLRLADQAMYRAKEEGRDRSVVSSLNADLSADPERRLAYTVER